MTTALYVRVSTDEQAEHGYSIDVQKDRLAAYCVSQGWDDYKLYIDDGYTGTNLSRPAMKRMIRHIEEGKIKSVVVMKLDRLSRKQKDVMHLLEDVFEKNNVVFKSSTEPFDTSTTFGKAMIGVLAVFAQLERDMIVERTTAGRRQSVSNGKWYGGRVPFGYFWNKDNERLEIVPEEAHIVREVFKRYITGHSRLAIAEWVSDRSKARVFDHSVIREMLSRPVYMGKFMNAGDLVEGKHDAIIDEDTWYAAQREVKERADGASPMGEYMLTGLLECGVCAGNVVHVKRVTRKNGKTYTYDLYACKNQHVRQKDRNNNCSLGYHRREKVQEFVINEIKLITANPDKLEKLLARKEENHADSSTKDALQAKLEEIIRGLENLYEAIQTGEIKASYVSARIKGLEEEREAIETQLDDLIENSPQPKRSKETIKFFQNVGSVWDILTEEEQKSIIRKVISKVTLQKDGLHHITWNL